MTIANWCVLVAAWLPILCAGLAKGSTIGKRRSQGGYDNADPRTWFDGQSGWRKRADNAQKNGFEALPFFIGAVALAQIGHGPQAHIDQLAMIYIVLRVAYIVVYLADWATVRSLVWFGAMITNILILLASGTAAG